MTNNKDSLNDFFNSIGGEKKKIKEEKDKIIGDLSLDNLFSSMEEESRKIKEEKKQLKKDVEAFKNLLFKEEKKEEKPSVDEYIEPPRPEEEIADVIRQSEEDKEETVVEHAVKILDKINEEVETVETEPDLAKLKKEIEILKQVVYEQGGGGEVRLEFLDDVDRDSVKVDGKFLKYQSSTGKFIGADASGGGGSVGAAGTWAVDSVGINTSKSVGIGADAVSGIKLNVAGKVQLENEIKLKSDDGTPGRIDLYCEVSNAHYLRLQAPAHSSFSGNPTVVLPNSAGTLLLSDGSGASLTNLNASNISSGTINSARIPTLNQDTTGTSAGLTGTPSISVVDITSRHINSSGVVTATSFVGDGSGLTNVTGAGSTDRFNTPVDFNKGVNITGVTTGLNVSGVGTIGTLQATNATISGNLSIGGTLTYEDVTSIDSVGLITARGGMVVSGVSTFLGSQKGINVVGVSTFAGNVNLSDNDILQFGDSQDLKIYHDSTQSIIADTGTGQLAIRGGVTVSISNPAGTQVMANFINGGAVNLFHAGVNRFKTTSTGAVVTGILTATSFSGDVTGNAATATALETARTIGGVSFDGTGNINLPGVNSSGNQDTSGNASTATVATNAQGLTGTPNVAVGNITVTGDLTVEGTTNSQTSTDTTVTGILTATSINVGSTATGIGLTFDQGGMVVSGISTLSGTVGFGTHVTLEDYAEIRLGEKVSGGNRVGDFVIRHDPTMFSSVYNVIQSTNGNIQIENRDTGGGTRFLYLKSDQVQLRSYTGNKSFIDTKVNQWVKLFYNNSEKLATTDTGINITGTSVATSAVVGSAVTVNSTGVDAGAGIVTATKFSGNTAQGGGNDSVFQMNGMTVTQDFEFPDGQSAMSVGPITINSGVEVTVPDGQNWVIL